MSGPKRTVAGKEITLNTRIQRILNKAVELKHFSFDTSYQHQTTSAAGAYVNFLTNIAVGTGSANRIGTHIVLDYINITITAQAPIEFRESLDTQTRVTICRSSNMALSSPTLAAVAFTDFVRSGFNATGDLNTENYKIIKDRKVQTVRGAKQIAVAIAGGSGQFHTNVFHKFRGGGKRLNYSSLISTEIIDGAFIISLQSLCPGNFGATQIWTYYMGVTVGFRDA